MRVPKVLESAACFFAILAISHCALHAGTTGSIFGTVTDPSGSVLPGAKLTLTNTAQGVQNKATSDSKGAYTFPSLPVGQYRLQVEAPGFRSQDRTGLRV